MKTILFSNWHIMRIIRLAFAIFLFFQAYTTHEWFFILFGLFFLFQALFNVGCSTNSCSVNYKQKENEK